MVVVGGREHLDRVGVAVESPEIFAPRPREHHAVRIMLAVHLVDGRRSRRVGCKRAAPAKIVKHEAVDVETIDVQMLHRAGPVTRK